MKKYLAVAKISFASVMQNRLGIVIANLQSVFTLFVLFFFWQAVFSGRDHFNGYTFSQIVTYYFLIRVTYNRVSTFNASSLAKDIKSGEVVKYLLRPYDFTLYFISTSFTRAALWSLGNLLAISLYSFYLYQYLVFPSHSFYWLAYGVTFILNGILSICLNLLIGYIGFWIGEVTHLKLVSTVVINVLSGGLIPLAFFPLWFQQISLYLPFRFLVQFPADVFFGRLDYWGVIRGEIVLFFWILVLFTLARVILASGLRTYESYN
jgi:ABC-2 type transport system permease protein